MGCLRWQPQKWPPARLTQGPPLGPHRGVPWKSRDMGLIHLQPQTEDTGLRKAPWDHTGGGLDIGSALGYQAVTLGATLRLTLWGVGAQTLCWRSGGRGGRRANPQGEQGYGLLFCPMISGDLLILGRKAVGAEPTSGAEAPEGQSTELERASKRFCTCPMGTPASGCATCDMGCHLGFL